MVAALRDRLGHIAENIEHVFSLLDGLDYSALAEQPVTRAALERYLEIVSEASRHIPDALKAEYGDDIPWRAIAGLGNVLRHAYHLTDLKVLWRIYEQDLVPLQTAVQAMLCDPKIR